MNDKTKLIIDVATFLCMPLACWYPSTRARTVYLCTMGLMYLMQLVDGMPNFRGMHLAVAFIGLVCVAIVSAFNNTTVNNNVPPDSAFSSREELTIEYRYVVSERCVHEDAAKRAAAKKATAASARAQQAKTDAKLVVSERCVPKGMGHANKGRGVQRSAVGADGIPASQTAAEIRAVEKLLLHVQDDTSDLHPDVLYACSAAFKLMITPRNRVAHPDPGERYNHTVAPRSYAKALPTRHIYRMLLLHLKSLVTKEVAERERQPMRKGA